MKGGFNRSKHSESGQTLIFSAFCLSLLLGFVALAVDVGLLWRDKRMVQTAADGGAMNGAAEIGASDWEAGANAGAALNGMTNGVNGATVTVNKPPLYGAYAGNKNYVEVIASQSEKTVFMGLFGFPSMTVSARAVAYNTPSQDCIITLATNPQPVGPGPSAAGAGINSSGGGSLNATNCGIVDNGDESGESAVDLSGGAKINAKSLSTAGTVASGDLSDITVTNPSTVTTGITPVSDPLAGTVSPPANPGGCLANPNINSSTTIGPSGDGTICYDSLTIKGGAVTLQPGVYYINGQLSIQSGANVEQNGASGEGVTFYITNTTAASDSCPASPDGAGLCVAAGAALNLSAPTTGPYAGILFYQDPNDTMPASFSGGSSGTISGIFYLPDAGLILSGGSGGTLDVDLVVAWLNLSGGSTINQYEALDVNTVPSPVLAE
jgi:Putative Flp pilus-assembly TadE/G-like